MARPSSDLPSSAKVVICGGGAQVNPKSCTVLLKINYFDANKTLTVRCKSREEAVPFHPPASKASREVVNLTEKNRFQYYAVKEFVASSLTSIIPRLASNTE